MESSKKNHVLKTLALLLKKNKDHILKANVIDLRNCIQYDDSLTDRLKVDEKKIKTMIQSLEEV